MILKQYKINLKMSVIFFSCPRINYSILTFKRILLNTRLMFLVWENTV